MSKILDEAEDAQANEFRLNLRMYVDRAKSAFAKPIESPIEEAMLIAFVGFAINVPFIDIPGMPEGRLGRGYLYFVRIRNQIDIAGYRADFTAEVFIGDEVIGRIAVECDGHAFHDRTPDQAARDKARDRAFTIAGYHVMRFTGREIYRDAAGCVDDIFQASKTMFEAHVARKGSLPSK